jgi:large subunit ribosomal protein L15
MQKNTLTPVHSRIKVMRVGRGGKRGKTSGKGNKGQKARSGRKMRPEMRDLIKKIPKLRGHGKNRSRTVRQDKKVFLPVNISVLETVFVDGDSVTPAILVKKGVLSLAAGRMPKIKILGNGTLSKKLTVSAHAVSVGAKAAIEKAGGTITV